MEFFPQGGTGSERLLGAPSGSCNVRAWTVRLRLHSEKSAGTQGPAIVLKYVSIGYNSANPAEVRRQIQDMKSRGFDGACIAWYGGEPGEQSNEAPLQL